MPADPRPVRGTVPVRPTVERLEDRVTPALTPAPARLLFDQAVGYHVDGLRVGLLTRSDALVVGVSSPDVLAALTAPSGPLAGMHVERMLAPTLALFTDPAMGTSDPTGLLLDRVRAAEATAGVVSTAPVYVSSQTGGWMATTGELVVALRPGLTPEAAFGSDSRFVGWRRLDGTPDEYRVAVRGGMGDGPLTLGEQLQADPRFAWVTPNFYQDYQRFGSTDDPLLGSQWSLNNTGQNGGTPGADASVTRAWSLAAGGSPSVTIAVLDDGMEFTHPDLAPNLFVNAGETPGNGVDDDGNGWPDDRNGWDFTSPDGGDNDPGPDVNGPNGDAHATAVAGIAAARGNNTTGVAGVAYNAKILPVRVFSGTTSASDADIASAIYYAAGRTKDGTGTWKAADVINCSWGGGGASSAITTAFTWATTQGRQGKGALVVVSTGNDGTGTVAFPADLSSSIPGLIAVGASTNQDVRAPYSQYGPGLDLLAPSGGGTFGIVTTDRTGANGYDPGDYTTAGEVTGTSAAAPVVAGTAALVLSRDPNLTAAQIRGLLQNTTDLIGPSNVQYDPVTGWNPEYGYGRINAYTAVSGVGKPEIQVLDGRTDVPNHSTSVDFGPVTTTGSATKIFRVRNQGTKPLTLGPITTTGVYSVERGFTDTVLDVGESTTFVIRFTPSADGSNAGQVSFPTNDADENPFEFGVGGTGVPASISGYSFEDFDGHGVRDGGDPGLAGRTVYLDENGNGSFDSTTETASSGTVNLAVPDNDPTGVTSSISVTGASGAITDLNVTVNLTHPFASDLTLTLVTPTGRSIVLADRRGGPGANFAGTTFDDEAGTPVAAGAAPFTGHFRPDQPLSAADGLSANGTWQLKVVDQAGNNVGTLTDWSLTYTTGEPWTTTDGFGFYSFSDVPAGAHTVAQVVPSGWAMTTPASYTVSLPPGGSVTGKDFGQAITGAVYGRVVDDQDGDGAPDASEPGLAGWRVYLDANGNGTFQQNLGTVSFNSGAVNLAVPDDDPTGVTSTVDVSGQSGLIADLNVTVDLSHARVGDLRLELIAPDGRSILLADRAGGAGADYAGTTFDDEAGTPIAAGAAPFTGHFRPGSPLAALDGLPLNGTWGLRVTDLAAGTTGMLNDWSLAFTATEPSAVTDAAGRYRIRAAAGSYTLRVEPQAGWANTLPASGSYPVTLTAGGAVAGKDFGEHHDSDPPTAALAPVTPDPRNSAVESVAVTFSEPVVGVDVSDFVLTRDGTPVSLAGATVTGSGSSYTLTGLSAATAAQGGYRLTLAAGPGVTDLAGNPLAAGAAVTWTTDEAAPVAVIQVVSPDPRDTPLPAILLTFSEPVTGLDVGDFVLTRNGTPVSLAGATLSPLGGEAGVTYALTGLAALTSAEGTYVLTLVAAGSGIADRAGNPLRQDAARAWRMDRTDPTAGFAPVTPDLRTTPVDGVTVTFSEPVVGLVASDFLLTRDGVPVALTGVTLSGVGATYTLSGLAALTAADGTYRVTLSPTRAGVRDDAGNPIGTVAAVTWRIDRTPPTAALPDLGGPLRNTPLDGLTITFSEAVTGFDLSDLTLTRNGAPVSLGGAELTGSGASYQLGGLAGVTAADGVYVFGFAPGSDVRDAAGNLLANRPAVAWSVDATPPTVGTAVLESDPGRVVFRVVFSEPVTGFTAAGVVVGGTAGATSATVSADAPGNGTAYVVTVTGMTGSGSVDLAVAGGAAVDAAGNRSRSADPVVAMVAFPAPPPAGPPTRDEVSVAVGADAGGSPTVRVFGSSGAERFSQTVFEPAFTGGVRTATGDFNGDGVPDVAVGTGPGRVTLVRVLDGKTGQELFRLQPFEDSFTGGVYVAAGDVTGDGIPDLVVTPDQGGGPRVRVFSGAGFGLVADFLGIDDPRFRGGARAAVGDLNGDGVGDLIVAAGFGGGPRVAVFDGRTLGSGNPVRLIGDFFAFEEGLRNGVYVAAGDLDGDGAADLAFGGGPGGGPRVRVASGRILALGGFATLDQAPVAQMANFLAGDSQGRGGVRLAIDDANGDGRPDLVVGAGQGGGSRVVIYAGGGLPANGTPPALRQFDALPSFRGGVFVG